MLDIIAPDGERRERALIPKPPRRRVWQSMAEVVSKRQPKKRAVAPLRPKPVLTKPAPLTYERDVPYEISKVGSAGLELPLNRLRAPRPFARPRLGLSLKFAVLNAFVLILGCLLVWGAVGQLRVVAESANEFRFVQAKAQRALADLVTAGSALAETDFAASEAGFISAQQSLNEAKLEFDQALADSRAIVKYVDVTGTVRSGEKLLQAGAALTEAGQRLARGMALLFEFNDQPMAQAVRASRVELQAALGYLDVAQAALAEVDSVLLPEAIATQLERWSENLAAAKTALATYVEQSDQLLFLLGDERDRQYLLLFQNNHELRPTGGFIGSVGLLRVDRGEVESLSVDSVYEGDGQLKDFLVPPAPLKKITERWYLRDANWFIDWPTSAKKTAEFFESEGGPTVDGVIALTPTVIARLLNVTGPIEMPEYEVVVDADNFHRVTQTEVSYDYDKELNRPKQFMSDLAPRLMAKLFALPADSAFEASVLLTQLIKEKSLLLYFTEEAQQGLLEELNLSGGLPKEQAGFIAVNNANVGGHKSDQFIEQKITAEHEIKPNGDVEVTLTIRRAHSGPIEGVDLPYAPEENPAQKTNYVWQRVLVPPGARLLDARGFTSAAQVPTRIIPEDLELREDEDLAVLEGQQTADASGTVIGEEAGYTSFGNWVATAPGEVSVAQYRYRLLDHADLPSALDPAERLVVFVSKQPGDERTKVDMTWRLPEGARIVHTGPTGVVKTGAREASFSAELNKDLLAGLVFERE